MRINSLPKFNIYFFIPFLIWVAVGGIMLLVFGKRELFMMVNSHYNPFIDWLMAMVTRMGQPEVIITALLALMGFQRLRNWRYFLLAVCCNVIPLVIQQSLKRVYHVPRPLLYYNRAQWIHHLPEWPDLLRDSFPSGHSQGAFSFFCFLTLLLPPKYRPAGVIFFLLALAVGYSRLYLAAHFFEDVYAGSILGVTITTALFILLQRIIPISTSLPANEQLA